MQRLYHLRHGLSVLNEEGRWAGSIDTPLAKKGKKQAKEAAKLVRKYNIDCIVSSPLSRALETAQIIAKQIDYPLDKIITNPLLVERHFGDLEGQGWRPNFDISDVAGIETREEILQRAKAALKWLHTLEVENILVVSHGSFGRALRSLLLPEYPFNNKGKLGNAKIHQWL
jgi:uncharacterized phosphatase